MWVKWFRKYLCLKTFKSLNETRENAVGMLHAEKCLLEAAEKAKRLIKIIS